MPQHLFYSAKIGLLALLFATLIAEHFMDYSSLFDVSVESRKQPELKSTGIIGQYIKQYDYAKYQHVIDNNIFSQNVIAKQKPVEIVTPIIKPFTIQLEIKGIAMMPGRKMVMVWDRQRNESQLLLEKEEWYEWKVVSIKKHMVTLEHETGGMYDFFINEEALTTLNMQR